MISPMGNFCPRGTSGKEALRPKVLVFLAQSGVRAPQSPPGLSWRSLEGP